MVSIIFRFSAGFINVRIAGSMGFGLACSRVLVLAI